MSTYCICPAKLLLKSEDKIKTFSDTELSKITINRNLQKCLLKYALQEDEIILRMEE